MQGIDCRYSPTIFLLRLRGFELYGNDNCLVIDVGTTPESPKL